MKNNLVFCLAWVVVACAMTGITEGEQEARKDGEFNLECWVSSTWGTCICRIYIWVGTPEAQESGNQDESSVYQ